MSKTMIAHGFVHTVPRDIGSAFVARLSLLTIFTPIRMDQRMLQQM